MSKTLVFKGVENINDFKNVIEENIDYISRRTTGFIKDETLELALQGLNTFPKEQEKRFIAFLKKIDKSFSHKGAYMGNAFHKFPISITGAIFYSHYPETIENLTLDEIVLLSNFSFTERPEFFATAVDKYGRELLSAVIEKTNNNNEENLSIFMWADKMIDVDNKTREETLEYIKKTPKEKILDEEKKYTIELFKDVSLSW